MLALCRAEKTEHIAAALARYLATEAYAQRRGAKPMDPDYAQAAVVVNHPVAAAGELTLDARSV